MMIGLSYTLYWFPVPNYNPDNFYKNNQNIFGDGGVLNILAIPPHVNAKINLLPVSSNTETYMDAHNAEMARREKLKDATN